MENNRKLLRFFDREDYQKTVPKSDQANNKPVPLFEKEYPQDTRAPRQSVSLAKEYLYHIRF